MLLRTYTKCTWYSTFIVFVFCIELLNIILTVSTITIQISIKSVPIYTVIPIPRRIHSIYSNVKSDYFNYITSYDVLCITLTCCSITGKIIHLSTFNIIENYYLIITKLNFRISSRIGFIFDIVNTNYRFWGVTSYNIM